MRIKKRMQDRRETGMKKNKSWKKGLALLTAAALTAASLTGPGMVAYAEGRQAAEENLRRRKKTCRIRRRLPRRL